MWVLYYVILEANWNRRATEMRQSMAIDGSRKVEGGGGRRREYDRSQGNPASHGTPKSHPKVIQKKDIACTLPTVVHAVRGRCGYQSQKYLEVLGSQHAVIRPTCFSLLSRQPLYHRTITVAMRRLRRRRLKCSAALKYLRIATESVMNGCQHRGWVDERAGSSPWSPSSP